MGAIRPAAGQSPIVTAEIDILDGQFIFEEFPYPLSASGKITVDQDPRPTRRLRFVIFAAAAPAANENCIVEISGRWVRLRRRWVCGVVKGENIALSRL